MRKLLVMFTLLLGMLALPLAMSGLTASAAPGDTDVVAVCQEADEFIDEQGITFGECVNMAMGPASEQSNNVIAAFCGVDPRQAFYDTTNKGQCIKVVRPRSQP